MASKTRSTICNYESTTSEFKDTTRIFQASKNPKESFNTNTNSEEMFETNPSKNFQEL